MILFLTSDIDECAKGKGGCEHNCENSGGNFTCTCNSGYELNNDGFACNGKPTTREIVVCFIYR